MVRWRSERANASTALIRHLSAAVGLVLVVSAVFALMSRADERDGTDTGEAAPPAEEQVNGEAEAGEVDGPAEPAPEPEVVEPEEPEDPRIPPESITIQVLDGYQQDGGTAAAGVTEQLREFGYRVVAENPAIAYEITTVLWTEGNEDAARQVAEDIEAAEVREQPGNLSAQVTVHVVVGADRAG